MRFAVVHSLGGYDEISLTSDFKVMMSESEKIYSPEFLGFERTVQGEIYGANAVFAIAVVCPELTIEDCIAQAQREIQSGAALETFKKFITLNN